MHIKITHGMNLNEATENLKNVRLQNEASTEVFAESLAVVWQCHSIEEISSWKTGRYCAPT